jgi:hypothetical protein
LGEFSLENLKKDIIGYYGGYCWEGENQILNSFSLIKIAFQPIARVQLV